MRSILRVSASVVSFVLLALGASACSDAATASRSSSDAVIVSHDDHPAGYIAWITNSDGRREGFGSLGADYGGESIRHTWETAPGRGDWQVADIPVGGKSYFKGVQMNADGHLEIFALQEKSPSISLTTAYVIHAWQDPDSPGGWSTAETLTDMVVDYLHLTEGRNSDGRLEIFFYTDDGLNLMHMWQTTPNGGDGWSDPVEIPTSVRPKDDNPIHIMFPSLSLTTDDALTYTYTVFAEDARYDCRMTAPDWEEVCEQR